MSTQTDTVQYCDRCVARAEWAVSILNTTEGDDTVLALTFCNHHYNRHREALSERAIAVIDLRTPVASDMIPA